MKPLVLIGILFIIVGVIALGYQGFTYVSRDTVVDAGPVQVTANREHTVPLPPIVGGVALVAGVAITVLAARKTPA